MWLWILVNSIELSVPAPRLLVAIGWLLHANYEPDSGLGPASQARVFPSVLNIQAERGVHYAAAALPALGGSANGFYQTLLQDPDC